MKLNYLLISFLCCMIAFLSCKNEIVKMEAMDSVPPGPISHLTWEGIPGGAIFKYTLPDDEDLHYVKAVFYRTNGTKCETSSTIYCDSLKIEGLGDTEPKEVQLIAVDRSANQSVPVLQTIIPEAPDIYHIGESLELKSDFGGIHAFWKNPMRRDISVLLFIKDHNAEYIPLDTYYSSVADGDGLYIGMDTVSVDCAIYAQDRWGNRSEMKYFPELIPLYETKFDRQLFRALHLPGDGPDYTGGWRLEQAFDGVTGGDSGYSSQGGSGIWPQSVTIDLGVTAKISRVRLFQRMGNHSFSEGNLKLFEIYGCADLKMDGSWDNWQRLIQCESIKPSGLPLGENSDEDLARARDGENFYNSADNPAVRYIRIKVLRTWTGGDNFQLNEIEFFGDNR